jgi:hypothetical protein
VIDNCLNDLCENLWEGLNGKITLVEELSSNQVLVKLICDDWKNANAQRSYNIICKDVAASKLVPMPCDEIAVNSEHVLLWQYNAQHYDLFYSSKPENGYEILGMLWEAHERALGDFAECYSSINAINFISHFKSGYGLLARGPKSLIESYQSAVVGKINLNVIESYNPEGGYSILFFDNSYIIAKSFETI